MTRPDGDKLYLYYRHANWIDPTANTAGAEDYSIRLRTTEDPEQGWSESKIVVPAKVDGRVETVDVQYLDGQFVMIVLDYSPGAAVYISPDGMHYERCRLKNLRNHLPGLYRPNPAGNLSGLLVDGKGRLRFINTAGFTDSRGHYTQWIYPAEAGRQ